MLIDNTTNNLVIVTYNTGSNRMEIITISDSFQYVSNSYQGHYY